MIGVLDDHRSPVGRDAGRQHWSGRPTSKGNDGVAELDVARCVSDGLKSCSSTTSPIDVDEEHGRWESVEELLADGIDVITTVNISNLESMGDIVATHHRQRRRRRPSRTRSCAPPIRSSSST